jgi:bifunctional pyridoxal-dependent enzyme with beta-cystathionase and maltose regulon repressor activities
MEEGLSTSHTEERPASTNRQSWCSPHQLGAPEQDIQAFRKMLKLVSKASLQLVLVLTVRPILVLHVQFAETEVAESNMARVIEEDVFGFQITVNDVESVQAFQCTQQLSSVESSTVDVESLFLLQMVEQLSAIHKRQDKVQLLR